MTSKTVYSSLNGLRGVAALAVVVGHCRPFFPYQVAPGFHLAVDLFFALSGFVVTSAYATLLAERRVREFAVIRLLRFYPLYVVGLAIGLALAAALVLVGSPSALEPTKVLVLLLFALVFIPSPFGGDIFPLNVPAWSLFYELVVNIAYAASFSALSNRAVCGVVAVSGFGLLLVFVLTGNAAQGATLETAATGVLRAVFSFSVGVLIWRCRFGRPSLNPYLALAFVGIIFVAPIPPTLRIWFDFACIFIVFPCLLVLVVAGDRHCRHRFLDVLGDSSYALYAVHYPIVWLVRGAAENLNLAMTLTGICLVGSLIPLSYALDRWFDKPARAALKTHFLTARYPFAVARTDACEREPDPRSR